MLCAPIEGLFFSRLGSDQFNRHHSRLPFNQAKLLLISNKLSRELLKTLMTAQLILYSFGVSAFHYTF